jgi:hypothetical protein
VAFELTRVGHVTNAEAFPWSEPTELNQPLEIAFYNGTLHIADRANGVIPEVNSTTGDISTVVGDWL